MHRRQQFDRGALSYRFARRAGQQCARLGKCGVAAFDQRLHAGHAGAISPAHDLAGMAQVQYRLVAIEQCAGTLEAIGGLIRDESHQLDLVSWEGSEDGCARRRFNTTGAPPWARLLIQWDSAASM